MTLSPIPSHLPRPLQAFPCISTGVFGELGAVRGGGEVWKGAERG